MLFLACSQKQYEQIVSAPPRVVEPEIVVDMSKSELIGRIVSDNRLNVVNTYIMELERRINTRTITDIDDKYDIYNKIKQCGDNLIIYKFVYLLSKLPTDNKILSTAKRDLKSHEISHFIAGYAYLIRKDEKYLTENCKFDNYENIDPLIRYIFLSTAPIIRSREQWIKVNIENYLTWNPRESKTFIVDQGNPYRLKLLQECNHVAEYIVSRNKEYIDPVLPHDLIWLLGEIGDSCSFELLLDAHCYKPDYRTAISLGACVGSLQLEKMFTKSVVCNFLN
jgi:hypothetical protein